MPGASSSSLISVCPPYLLYFIFSLTLIEDQLGQVPSELYSIPTSIIKCVSCLISTRQYWTDSDVATETLRSYIHSLKMPSARSTLALVAALVYGTSVLAMPMVCLCSTHQINISLMRFLICYSKTPTTLSSVTMMTLLNLTLVCMMRTSRNTMLGAPIQSLRFPPRPKYLR